MCEKYNANFALNVITRVLRLVKSKYNMIKTQNTGNYYTYTKTAWH